MSKYMCPNGPVIAYGYTIDGVLQVTIKKGQNVDTAKENEIYNLFSNYGQELNVTNIPLTIVYGDFSVPTIGRNGYWSPLIGGIQIVSDGTGGAATSTLGFAAQTSSGTSVRVILTPEAADAYHSFLSKASDSEQEEVILNAFLQKIELLKDNVHYRQPIAKKLIPAEYKTKYESGMPISFRAPLPSPIGTGDKMLFRLI